MKSTVLLWMIVGFGALFLSLVLTPIVRELCRKAGMIDNPDPRRINKVPIPRGGGIAVFVSAFAAIAIAQLFSNAIYGIAENCHWFRLVGLSFILLLIGVADDKWSLAPKVKLAGQLLVAFLVWYWVGLGFSRLWPELPAWADAPLTVFWIVGAINAFNLIDGLDGLAAGIALIATISMGGALILTEHAQHVVFFFAFGGALLGFLRYNYNPASVFLGDSGSMYIGYVIATMPLVMMEPGSFVVSVGVPVLAMGVPIFDTTLAIVRRTIRRAIHRRGDGEFRSEQVMTADTDHLHHRILRSVGLSQRKAAWTLYLISITLVAFGLVDLMLSAHKAGLWLVATTVIAILVVRDAAKVEFFDVGRLLGSLAHDTSVTARRRRSRVAVPLLVAIDLAVLAGTVFLLAWILYRDFSYNRLVPVLLIRVTATFCALVFFRAYTTVWSRAVVSNYLRLLLACVLGSVVGTVGIYYAPGLSIYKIKVTMLLYALIPFVLLALVRLFRAICRDLFFLLDCRRLLQRDDVARVIVYGCGMRYHAFRHELIRRAAANDRVVVGILDDDLCMKGKFIGGVRVWGTINDAPEAIRRLRANRVVITCMIAPEWLKVVKEILAPTGVELSVFELGEREIG